MRKVLKEKLDGYDEKMKSAGIEKVLNAYDEVIEELDEAEDEELAKRYSNGLDLPVEE